MSLPSPAYFEIIEFIAAGTTSEAVADFRPSPEAQRRVSELVEREKEESSPDPRPCPVNIDAGSATVRILRLNATERLAERRLLAWPRHPAT